jgi:hypothetical protein
MILHTYAFNDETDSEKIQKGIKKLIEGVGFGPLAL